MNPDEIKRYEEIKKQAAKKVDEWFIANPNHFHTKAREIFEKHKAWEKESARLNPKDQLTFRDPESGIWYPDATKHFAERKEPSLFDPFLFCICKFETKWNSVTHCNEVKTKIPMPSNKDDALLVYYTVLLILHDTTEGYVSITDNIWPREPLGAWSAVQGVFDPFYGDKTAFIESGLSHVQNDLASGGKADLTNEKPAKTEYENKNLKEKQEGLLEPKPPEFLQNLLWIWRYGRSHWKLVLLAILTLLILSIFVLPKFDLFSKIYTLIKNIHF